MDSIESSNTTSHMVDGVTSFVTLIQFVMSVTGILLYILTCWIMVKHRKTTFSNPFYTLALALAVPDGLHLSMEIVCAVPVVFVGYENVPTLFVAVCGYLTDLSYWCLAPLMVVIGINRYVAVCHFQSYKKLFSPGRIKIIIIVCYISGFFIPSLMYSCTCIYLFKGYAWKFYCNGGCEDQALTTNSIISSSLTIAVALIYSVIFIQYKLIQCKMSKSIKNRHVGPNWNEHASTKQSKKEAALMFQFFLISIVLILYIGLFWFISFVWTNRYGDMFLNFFVSLNSVVSPILYLSFGSEFRSRLPWMKRRVANGQALGDVSVSAMGASARRTITQQVRSPDQLVKMDGNRACRCPIQAISEIQYVSCGAVLAPPS